MHLSSQIVATELAHPLSLRKLEDAPARRLPRFRAKKILLAHIALGLMPSVAHAVTLFPGTTAIGQQSASLSVTVTISATGVATAPQALTQGIAGFDFSIAAGGTCAANASYIVGQTCTVSVVFGPKYPGLRTGAVVLKTSAGVLLGSSGIAGNATGPLAVLNPGMIDTVAGNGALNYLMDGVPATQAAIYLPNAVTADVGGNFFIADTFNNRVRRVDAKTKFISTIAGNGIQGYSGDGGLATNASINQPSGLAIDGAGNIYFSDSGNNIVRRIDAVSGIVTTVAGLPGTQGYSGDGFAATLARLYSPRGIAFDVAGNLYIGDTNNNVVREVSVATGNIATVAGTGVAGYNGDGIAATTAQLYSPWGVYVDVNNALFIADKSNERIRKVAGGQISTVAGTGIRGIFGDGGPATGSGGAQMDDPTMAVTDPAGNLYIADSGNNRVRKVYAATNMIQSVSGNFNNAYDAVPEAANKASLYAPSGIFLDQTGTIYVADTLHNRIRIIYATQVPLTYSVVNAGTVSPPVADAIENDGNANLSLSTPVLVNAALDPGTTSCSFTVPMLPAATCNLGVEFAPTTTGATVLGSVTVGSNSVTSPAIISLSGQVVNVVPTTLSLSSSVNPSLVGQTVALTATVSSTDPSPTGPITFFDGAATICSNIVPNATGSAICSTILTLGQHSLTAGYAGDTNSAPSVSPALIQIVKQQPNLGLSVSPNLAVVTSPVTLTLAATGTTGTPTGTVVFYDGAAAIGSTVTLAANGVATFTTTQLTPGQHTLTAKYSGDATNIAATSNAVIDVVSQASTTTALATTNSNITVGTPVTFTATVASAIALPPTGTVQFTQGSAVLGVGTLDSTGHATLTISTLSAGIDTIVATYNGDINDAGSTSSPVSEVVQLISTQVALTASANPASYGAPLSLTATVIGNGGVATGTVNFSYGGTAIGSAVLNASGVAVLTTSTLAPGLYSIVANYVSDGRANASTSPPLALAVRQITAITLTSNANPALTLNAIVLTAAVTTNGTTTATGNITFLDGATQIGAATLDGTGHAVLNVPSLAAGTHSLTASYVGDNYDFSNVSVALSEVVQRRTTTTAFSSAPTNLTNPQQLTFAAVVGFAAATAPPTGTIVFTNGSTVLGSSPINASGVANLFITIPPLTVYTVTATYSGDAYYAPSASPATLVSAGPTQFTLGLTPPSVTIQSTQHTVVILTINSFNSFSDTMQFGCIGLPYAATCTFSTAQVALSANGTATAQLTIDTGNPLGSGAVGRVDGTRASTVLACFLPGGILAGFALFYRRRSLRGLLLLLVAVAATLSVSGCAGLQNSGTPAGTYTFKVTASGQKSGATVSADMGLTVTQ